jgi:transposase
MDALKARLAELAKVHPKGKIVMSLPGMGTIMTAEFLAEVDHLWRFGSPDRFAAAAGIAPVLRASGSVSYRRRAKRGTGSEGLLPFGTSRGDVPRAGHRLLPAQTSRGEEAPQAVIALARRRVNVLWAMLRDGTFHEDRARLAA